MFLLGFAAIVLAQRLPGGVDAVMERFVGATLVILGGYVFYALARHGRDFRMRSRWMLLFSGVRPSVGWLRTRRDATRELVEIDHDHVHPVTDPHPLTHHHHDYARTGDAVVMVVGAGTAGAAGADHRHRQRHVAPGAR